MSQVALGLSKNGQGTVWGILHVLICTWKKTKAHCSQLLVPNLMTDNLFAKCFQGGFFPFLFILETWQNHRSWASLCVCTFCVTNNFDSFFEGMNEYQSFSNICFKFWNSCERDLRAELRTCISAWHCPAYSLVECLILLLQSCL